MWQVLLGGEDIINKIRIFPFQIQVFYIGNGK